MGRINLTYVSTRKSIRYAFEHITNPKNWETTLLLFGLFLIGYAGIMVSFLVFDFFSTKIGVDSGMSALAHAILNLAIYIYFGIIMLLGFGIFASTYFIDNGFPTININKNPENAILRIIKTISLNFLYVVFFWKEKMWLLTYLFFPAAIFGWFYHAIRLEFMLEIAMANDKLSLAECAKRSWEITKDRFFEQVWLHTRLLLVAIVLAYLPIVTITIFPSMFIPVGLIGLVFYAFFPLLVCRALSAAKITSIREYANEKFGNGSFSPEYFFSTDKYGQNKYASDDSGQYYWYGRNQSSQNTYESRGRYSQSRTEGSSQSSGQRKRESRQYRQKSSTYAGQGTYQHQYFKNIFDSQDGEWILSQLQELSLQSNYYQMLGLSANAAQTQIKETYRNLAMRFHPDRHNDNPRRQHLVGEIMKYINEAYAGLNKS